MRCNLKASLVKKPRKAALTLQYILAMIGGALAVVGFGTIILAAAFSIFTSDALRAISRTMIHLGPVHYLSGASVALYFVAWIPAPTSHSSWDPASNPFVRFMQWTIFFFSLASGVVLLGGLALAWAGYYWFNNTKIGNQGFLFYFIGVVLTLIRLSVVRRVVTRNISDEQKD